MTSQAEAPVNEVVLSISFPRSEYLTGPFLGTILGDLVKRYPQVEQQAPYEIPVEVPSSKNAAVGAVAMQGQIVFSSQPMEPRYWLTAPDNIALVQVQANYLAYNWRRKSENQNYPGFERLAEEFKGIKDEVSEKLGAVHQEVIKPERAEITYINIIAPNSLWSTHSEMNRVIAVSFPESAEAQQLTFSYSKEITSGAGDFLGRVHVSVQPAVSIATGGPLINLTVTARSANLDQDVPDAYEDFLRLAHDCATDSFRSLTTADARESWGLQ